jgi:hypothetical protein
MNYPSETLGLALALVIFGSIVYCIGCQKIGGYLGFSWFLRHGSKQKQVARFTQHGIIRMCG